MKIDADDLLITGLIVGGIICAPFLAVYYGGKWIYSRTPWELKKKRELNEEIHLLEEKLGLYGRNNKALHYDPYYYKNKDWNRKGYLENLKKKLENNYKSPHIILVTQESEGGLGCMGYSGDCQVLILAHQDYYTMPQNEKHPFGRSASLYFRAFDRFHKNVPDTIARLRTLSECGDYEKYFVKLVPGKFKTREVCLENERIKLFIENFKKNYKKEDANHSLC